MKRAVSIRPAAFLDPKLLAFRLLSMVPYQPLRAYGRRGFFGRRRAYVSVDLEFILTQLSPNPVIVDLGANEGAFSSQVARLSGELHAFEPDPSTFLRLKSNLAAHRNVTLYNMAVGQDDGEVELFRGLNFETDPHSASLSSSTIIRHENVNIRNSIKVQQVGIISLLEKIGTPIDLLKMDIEGSEVSVLERLFSNEILNSISIIIVETHEHCIPNLVDRTFELRRAARKLSHPVIVMDWH